MKRAAHFLFSAELAYSPPNEAIISGLLEAGYAIDVYAPGAPPDVAAYGARVSAGSFCYGRRWLLGNLASLRWRGYRVFSATAEEPFAIVGLLSAVHRRQLFLLVDEIKSGSYWGNDPPYLKRLHRWAMRRAAFCIVNDASRVPLLQAYAGITDPERILVYPGCFRDPPGAADRSALRAAWGIPAEALTIGVSGGFNETSGAEWLIESFARNPSLHLVVQAVNLSPFTRLLLTRLQGAERLYVQTDRLGWREAWATAPAVDIGLAIYLNPAPQFQNMGISSNRLCMFLAMGVPVIANRQPSFRFLEEYDCGVLVADQREFDAAIDHIAGRLNEMRRNALRCTREYIDAPGKYRTLQAQIGRL